MPLKRKKTTTIALSLIIFIGIALVGDLYSAIACFIGYWIAIFILTYSAPSSSDYDEDEQLQTEDEINLVYESDD